MRIIAIDDKKLPLEALVDAIEEAEPGVELFSFRTPESVLAWDGIASCDVAFVDIDMPGMTGMELADRLKALNPRMNVIFATGFGEYTSEAMHMHASGYITKPITAAKVRRELDDLRYPVEEAHANRLYVRCFGNFEVFMNGTPLSFDRWKTRELFAYLVDRRGAICSNGEIEAALWEDDSSSSGVHSYLRTLTSDLRRALERVGASDVLVKRRGALGVDTSTFDCDYYDYCEGKPGALEAFRGEYMSQFSWAETTLAQLNGTMW